MASEFEYNPTPVQGVTLGTRDAAEMAEYARRDRERRQQAQQQAAPDAGQQSGGGRQQRPVTMNQNTVGAVTSDGQVIQNPGYTPDAKRQDAFDNYARAGMRKNAEASRQQYFDTIRANESLQNDQFKRGVDEVNQRGFNLYGVLDDIDKAGGKDLSPEQGRMLEAATTDFGKQVAKNYGWQFNGAEYDWDTGTFTFQFQNAKGQVGTKTMSRDALNAQMVKAGYIDDPVEVRRREMEEQEKQRAEEQKQAQWAAEFGLKQSQATDKSRQEWAKLGQEGQNAMLGFIKNFVVDGQLNEQGQRILSVLNPDLASMFGVNVPQSGGGEGKAQKQPSAMSAALGGAGTGETTDSRRAQREISTGNAELDETVREQQRRAERTRELSRTPSYGVGDKGSSGVPQESNGVAAPSEQSAGRTGKIVFGSVGTKAEDEPQVPDRLAELRRRKDNGTLTAEGKNELSRLENQNKIAAGIKERQVDSTERAKQLVREAGALEGRTRSEMDRMNEKYAAYKKRVNDRKKEQAEYEANEVARKEALAQEKALASAREEADKANEAEVRRTGRNTDAEVANSAAFKSADRMDRILVKQAQNIDLTDEEKAEAKEYHRVMKMRQLAETARKKNDNDQSLTKEERDALHDWENLQDKHHPLASYVETKFSKNRKA